MSIFTENQTLADYYWRNRVPMHSFSGTMHLKGIKRSIHLIYGREIKL